MTGYRHSSPQISHHTTPSFLLLPCLSLSPCLLHPDALGFSHPHRTTSSYPIDLILTDEAGHSTFGIIILDYIILKSLKLLNHRKPPDLHCRKLSSDSRKLPLSILRLGRTPVLTITSPPDPCLRPNTQPLRIIPVLSQSQPHHSPLDYFQT